MRLLLPLGLTVAISATLGFSHQFAEIEGSGEPSGQASIREAPGASTVLGPSPAAPVPEPELDPPGGTAPRVALQAGHWMAADAPDELARLRTNGTRGGGKAEWEVTLRIAELTSELLREAGVEVDVLPTTVPPRYRADLFVSIHADGHDNPAATGFMVSGPRRDPTGQARDFAESLAESYREATGLRRNSNVTRRMENYYAFNSRRYTHALDPMTVAVIIETGFLTSPADRRVIVDQPERSAQGIAEGVLRFLELPAAPSADVPTIADR